jgi:NAD(P)-dependent dehydrogenase (short-subunit alcohol dehydrogenase family)
VEADNVTSIEFFRCDVTNWDDQVNLFRRAAAMTPSGTIDHVVANAGIAIDDEVFSFDGTLSVIKRFVAGTNRWVGRF